MPGKYDRFGVRFMYPENWKMTEEDGDDWPKAVTLESPQGAFWALHVYDADANLAELVNEAVDAFREEYDTLEAEELVDGADGADYGYNLDFYCLDLVITAHVRGTLLPDKTLVWICQGENRDFDACLPVFQAITATLLGKVPIQ